MMLDMNQVYKNFNAGTINEKKALTGLDIHGHCCQHGY